MLNISTPSTPLSSSKDTEALAPNLPLSDYVERVIRQYLTELDGDEPHNLHKTILNEVEKPLLSVIIEYTNGNQTKMAKILGLSRGTLRKKLAQHHLL